MAIHGLLAGNVTAGNLKTSISRRCIGNPRAFRKGRKGWVISIPYPLVGAPHGGNIRAWNRTSGSLEPVMLFD